MNRITRLFKEKGRGILSIYFTAGFPALDDTLPILRALQEGGADLVEIGMPFSDPVADGETIQQSNQRALDNGMTLAVLFDQLKTMRETVTLPVLLMGYINPVLQYGVEAFCQKCQEVGVDGLILPDLPLEVYAEEYKPIFDQHGLLNVFLITPQTSEARIRQIDDLTEGFIYMVSSASVTGAKAGISDAQEAYFQRVAGMSLKNPRIVGFGISNRETFEKANRHAHGAIIGSAFVKLLIQRGTSTEAISVYLQAVKGT
jgi:tryptophan synthase alpha chain